jgi:hypothetical protein
MQARSQQFVPRSCHSDAKPTSNSRPNASAHLCSVASVGFSILPVSNRESTGASLPQFSVVAALAIEKCLPVLGIGQFQGGDEQVFHAARIGGHGDILGRAFLNWRIPSRMSLTNSENCDLSAEFRERKMRIVRKVGNQEEPIFAFFVPSCLPHFGLAAAGGTVTGFLFFRLGRKTRCRDRSRRAAREP